MPFTPLLLLVRFLLLALLLGATGARADEASDLAQKVYDQAELVFEKLARSQEIDVVVRAEFLRGVLAFRRGDVLLRRVLESAHTMFPHPHHQYHYGVIGALPWLQTATLEPEPIPLAVTGVLIISCINYALRLQRVPDVVLIIITGSLLIVSVVGPRVVAAIRTRIELARRARNRPLAEARGIDGA